MNTLIVNLTQPQTVAVFPQHNVQLLFLNHKREIINHDERFHSRTFYSAQW